MQDHAVDDIVERQSTASELLAERAIALLREALQTRDEGERGVLRAEEKRVTRARRSVEKAIALLGDPSGWTHDASTHDATTDEN